MDNRVKWVKTRIQMGWTFLSAGVIMAVVGFIMDKGATRIPHLVTALGILSIGIGIGYLIRYGTAIVDERNAIRARVEEKDERTVSIKAQAGNRAYWVSAAFIYVGLMWESFASNGGLPPLSGDVLWFYLAAAVLVPFAVYMASILHDQGKI